MHEIDLEKLTGLSFVISIDSSDNLKNLCLHCEVYDFESDEYICTIRAKDFLELQDRIMDMMQ